jgi:hypothetical protein
MATKKITQFSSLAQGDLDSPVDVLPIVDVGAGETKKVTAKALAGAAVGDLVNVWNNVATTFSAIKLDVTDTASAAGSMLLNLLVGGAARFQVTKSTGVTLNKVCGTITMDSATLAHQTPVAFTLTNSAIEATDVVAVCVKSGGTAGAYLVSAGAVAAGSCSITLFNAQTSGNLSEAVVLQFAVIKAVAA